MKIRQQDISRDPETGKLTTGIAVMLEDHSLVLLKAKAKLYVGVMNELGNLVEAKLIEFEGRPK